MTMVARARAEPEDARSPTPTVDDRLLAARIQVRQIETFMLKRVHEARTPKETYDARAVMRHTVGLRRMLDRLA